jgi:predicted transcriptional regulator YdeE
MENLQLKTISIDTFRVIGISLPYKTHNIDGRSTDDCSYLWEKFFNENYSEKIPDKINNDVIAVYFEYEGGNSNPFSYLVGHRVNIDTPSPPGLQHVDIVAGKYLKVTAQGKMPECLQEAWNDIWQSDLKRTFQYDFEIYDQHKLNADYAEVDILVGIS